MIYTNKYTSIYRKTKTHRYLHFNPLETTFRSSKSDSSSSSGSVSALRQSKRQRPGLAGVENHTMIYSYIHTYVCRCACDACCVENSLQTIGSVENCYTEQWGARAMVLQKRQQPFDVHATCRRSRLQGKLDSQHVDFMLVISTFIYVCM